jgi:hypothetical protein
MNFSKLKESVKIKSSISFSLQYSSVTDRGTDEEVLHRVKEDRNILNTIKRKANWIGHIFRRNCLLKHVIEEKLEGRI